MHESYQRFWVALARTIRKDPSTTLSSLDINAVSVVSNRQLISESQQHSPARVPGEREDGTRVADGVEDVHETAATIGEPSGIIKAGAVAGRV